MVQDLEGCAACSDLPRLARGHAARAVTCIQTSTVYLAACAWSPQAIQESCKLDAVITVVDAKHIIQHLDEVKPEGAENEAVEQVLHGQEGAPCAAR